MTVRQLIEWLQQCDPDTKVYSANYCTPMPDEIGEDDIHIVDDFGNWPTHIVID